MKRNFIAFAIVLSFVEMIVSCNQSETSFQQEGTKMNTKSSVSKRSELALLMKSLYTDMDGFKVALDSDSVSIPSFSAEKYQAIHTAIPTDSTIREPQFAGMSDAFLYSLSELSKNPNVEQYNATVNACLQCHQAYCPGPIKKIKKLKL